MNESPQPEKDKIPRWAAAVRQFSARLWWKPMLVLTAACLLMRDQYPFSHYPMYSGFSDSTFYVHLADAEDRPLATYTTVGMSTPTLKKIYSNELRKERQRLRGSGKRMSIVEKKTAGERLLTALRNSPAARNLGPDFPATLRLYEVNIALKNGRFEKQSTLIAEAR